MVKIPKKSGMLLSTYNNPTLKDPRTLISGAIRLFTAGKYTHSAITIMIWGELFVIDSDFIIGKRNGIHPLPWEVWKKGRAYIHVFDPLVIQTPEQEKEYCLRVMSKTGIAYDIESIIPQLSYQITGKYNGKKGKLAGKKFICSVFYAWSYELKDWWSRSPINLWNNRFNDATNGKDMGEGKPEEFIVEN